MQHFRGVFAVLELDGARAAVRLSNMSDLVVAAVQMSSTDDVGVNLQRASWSGRPPPPGRC
jgi:hypothetical protein